MAETLKITAEVRDPAKNKGTGSRVSRRLRAKGLVPAIVYGHKEAPVPIAIRREDVALMLKKAAHLTELNLGGKTELAVVKDVQWDHLGRDILHLDFARVSAGEQIETEVSIVVHGESPGVKAGGILEVLLHSLKISCPATSIPDEIMVDISGVELNKGIHVSDLKLPPGVSAKIDPEQLVLHVTLRVEKAEGVTGEGTTAEPELIRRPEVKEAE